ncbi:MAG TPA: S8 family serine peptidase [Dehalococcoidia bacterium]|nr:S8 family serine peptidase [Dehalococcoidia bacterium]
MKHVRILFSVSIVTAVLALGLVTDIRQARGQRADFVVAVDAQAPLDATARAVAARGLTVDRTLDDLHALVVTAPAAAEPALASMAGVRYVERAAPVRAADTPSDPLYGSEYGYLQPVGAPAAWDITKGTPSTIVAVVDTGVDVQHPDLHANIWVNPREVPNNGVDDDGNGCVDDVNGCSFVSDSSPGCQDVTNGFVNDDIGHGTFVSGIIAAAGNGAGMVGVARNVRIMPIKVLDCFGAGDTVATARGIVYASRNGARVINLSLGGVEDSQVVRDAVGEAMLDGALVVAASGNTGGAGVQFPARIPGVLAVGAASRANPDARASFSSWGPEVGVVAVGEDVVGTLPQSRCNVLLPCIPGEGPYAQGDGTSFSTPQVSGLAALMFSLDPGLTPNRAADIIESSATALPPGATLGWSGYGRVNMAEALRAVRDHRAPGESCVVASVIDGETFTCQDGRTVRMLQIAAPLPGTCGGDWAKAALQYIFLPPGRVVGLRYDVTRSDGQGHTLAAPLWHGNDGGDYNVSIVMAYVGLAKASDTGAQNGIYRTWATAAEAWAHAAAWNMWGPGKPFTGGC